MRSPFLMFKTTRKSNVIKCLYISMNINKGYAGHVLGHVLSVYYTHANSYAGSEKWSIKSSKLLTHNSWAFIPYSQ